ncbi:MAG: hypothetical protein KDL31_07640 [Kiritimatiellae bacterium]|nr:hypothetical protein [Kiritimatiellia bacterium]
MMKATAIPTQQSNPIRSLLNHRTRLLCSFLAVFVCLDLSVAGFPIPQIGGSYYRPQWQWVDIPTALCTAAHEDWLIPLRSTSSTPGPVSLYASKPGADDMTLNASSGWTTWDPSGLYDVQYETGSLASNQVGIGTPGENNRLTLSIDLARYSSVTVTLYSGRECPPGFSPKLYAQGSIRGDFEQFTNEVFAITYGLQVTDIGFPHEAVIFSVYASGFEELSNPRMEVALYANGGAGTSAKLTAVTLEGTPRPPALTTAPVTTVGAPAFLFTTEAGKLYTLQSSEDLSNPDAWSNLTSWTDIPGDGTTMTASPPIQTHGCTRLSVLE